MFIDYRLDYVHFFQTDLLTSWLDIRKRKKRIKQAAEKKERKRRRKLHFFSKERLRENEFSENYVLENCLLDFEPLNNNACLWPLPCIINFWQGYSALYVAATDDDNNYI